MGAQVIIAGFSPNTDKTPGFYGETLYGVGNSSASSIPLKLLCVGLKATGLGSMTVDADIVRPQSDADCDAYAGAGGELATMGQAAFLTPNTDVYLAAPAAAGGAVAASVLITFTGTWTTMGTYSYRIGGKSRSITVLSSDNVTSLAAKLAADIVSVSRCPLTATPSAGVVTITCKTAGARGNNHIVFQDMTAAPSGLVSTFSTGTAVTGNGSKLGSGAGVESVANILALIATTQYDRIAIAQVDSTNLGLWKTQVDAQAGPTVGILGHVVLASNGTSSAAQTLANTTINDQRFQILWSLNNEQHPSEMAASFASLRTATEQSDPDAAYDDVAIPGGKPQTQVADRPSHATLLSCLNNGVTPVYTSPDGQSAIICRSIVTHCLNGSAPDYSTLDTSDAVVPDFVRADLRLYWTQVFKPGNPRVADNTNANERRRPSGVATPDVWNASVEGKLRVYEAGDGFPAPIIINVDAHKPISTYNASGRLIMSAVTVVPAPNNHAIGVSVRQAAA